MNWRRIETKSVAEPLFVQMGALAKCKSEDACWIESGILARSEPEHLALAKELTARRNQQVCVYREHPPIDNEKNDVPIAKILRNGRITNRVMVVESEDATGTTYDARLQEGETMVGEYDQSRAGIIPGKISYRFKGSKAAFEIWQQGNEVTSKDTVTGL